MSPRERGIRAALVAVCLMACCAAGEEPSTLTLAFNSPARAPLRITLRRDLAPLTVTAIVNRACHTADGATSSGAIYRNEAVPKVPPISCGSIGPCGPYSLVQGRLFGLENTPTESAPLIERGMVARIGNGADFFVALDEHHSWGEVFTVWGQVGARTLATLDNITKLPYHEQRSGATLMRLLDTELELSASCGGSEPAERAAREVDGDAEQGREL